MPNNMISVDFSQVLQDATDDQLKQKFDIILNQKTGLYSIYKVGITNNPYIRTYGHRFRTWVEYPAFLQAHGFNPADHAQEQPWKEMLVLYQSPAYQRIQAVEDLLVQKYLATSGKPSMVCWNERAGGAGRIPKTAPYYVYLLFG